MISGCRSTNGMVSIFVAHNIVRSIVVLVTYTLLTSGKIQTRNNYTSISVQFESFDCNAIAAQRAIVNGSVPRNNVTEPFRSVPFRKIITTLEL